MAQLSVTPSDALVDVPRQIVITGLQPDELVTITATTQRAGGVVWESQATFMADLSGRVDLCQHAPVGGDYAQIDPMGLLWSQEPKGSDTQNFMVDDVMQALDTQIVATTASGETTLQATLTQRFAAPGVTRSDVREAGLVGTLFTPPGNGPHPVVIILNGSTGGINEPRGALYASHGYQALALGYFKAPGLSPYITETPLEYFLQAFRWARDTLKPADGFMALTGQSRGGELTLLLGSLFPDEVTALIPYVPGAMVHGAQGAGDPARGGWSGTTWLLDGKPLPHLWQNNRAVHWHPWHGDAPPNRHHNVFFEGLKDRETAARARIPVENIKVPVLLISGRDDRAWPSSLYSRMVVSTLTRSGKGDLARHLDFDNAGHSINFPYLPTTQIVRVHPVSKVPFTSGGTPAGNAYADRHSWQGVLSFLSEIRQRPTR